MFSPLAVDLPDLANLIKLKQSQLALITKKNSLQSKLFVLRRTNKIAKQKQCKIQKKMEKKSKKVQKKMCKISTKQFEKSD